MNDRSRKERAMPAIVISAYGGPGVLTVTEPPDPVPAADEVLIRVRASGPNHTGREPERSS
jgi:NADPH:quinone reductase-like Zn-dependent oxidoreductase